MHRRLLFPAIFLIVASAVLCALPGLVINQPRKADRVEAILNNSFGMLGINSALIVKRFSQ